ncbi:hypothetical protein [Aeromicrobium duanguangcaii]|uniref:Uncharacterized protein n=1 Tax=Aeromicrobium duanguangcaii TaxID=2968086 RepID=A0ABY5KC68_9ACTN|nr:hypothetical protein [Aeromicrobium duanguangcaii]MCD9155294.1 hypothetical protein [Aeromicrobium duanguangcaii]MCL3838645.1 hypothetical protein [Aeromicrobium duanguangcaii]UUI68057.1 hypothetical protein NP095_12710 [Aeromicrobium duanguangcaii]
MFARLFRKKTKPEPVSLTTEERQAMQSRQGAGWTARRGATQGEQTPSLLRNNANGY